MKRIIAYDKIMPARCRLFMTGRKGTPVWQALLLVLTFLSLACAAGVSEAPRYCLSLRVLSAETENAMSRKAPIDPPLSNLGGINYLEGYVVDHERNDVILVGRRAPHRPSLHLDDLVADLRNAWRKHVDPFCSLDPKAEDIIAVQNLYERYHIQSIDDFRELSEAFSRTWGGQEIRVDGVPRDSRFAHVMIDADYHMKKVSQGHVKIPGIQSCLDAATEQFESDPTGASHVKASMSRFWFHIKTDSVSVDGERFRWPIYDFGNGAIWIRECPVVLLSENQLSTPEGELIDAGQDDPDAVRFAEQFSRRFPEIADFLSEYADLENLYRLHAIITALHYQESEAQITPLIQFLLSAYEYREASYMPPELPGLSNSKELYHEEEHDNRIDQYWAFPMVCGGVEFFTISNDNFRSIETNLSVWYSEVLSLRPSPETLVWEIPR